MAFTTQQAREAAIALAKAEAGLLAMAKPDLVAAVNAMDAFLGASQTAINNAFPEPFRSTATTPQKAALLSFVALRRWAG